MVSGRVRRMTTTPQTPSLSPVGVLTVDVAEAMDLAQLTVGPRRMIAVLGGALSGQLGEGVVVSGGADWQRLHADGTVSIDAEYVVRFDDGALATIHAIGVRAPSSENPYFATSIVFDAPASRPDLTQRLFLAMGTRLGSTARLDLFVVD